MTTGRINQVTIAGWRRHGASDGRSTHSRGRRAHVLSIGTTTRGRLANPPAHFTNGSGGHWRGQSPPTPERSTAVDGASRKITPRSHAKRCNPQELEASQQRERKRPLRPATAQSELPGKPGSTSAGTKGRPARSTPATGSAGHRLVRRTHARDSNTHRNRTRLHAHTCRRMYRHFSEPHPTE